MVLEEVFPWVEIRPRRKTSAVISSKDIVAPPASRKISSAAWRKLIATVMFLASSSCPWSNVTKRESPFAEDARGGAVQPTALSVDW